MLNIANAQYLRDDANEVVLDTTTNLIWQDNITPTLIQWAYAITYCESLVHGGQDNWRLPNSNELYSLADINKANPAISSVFQNTINAQYWSSTTYIATTSAWYVSFIDGDDGTNNKDSQYNVRCVR